MEAAETSTLTSGLKNEAKYTMEFYSAIRKMK